MLEADGSSSVAGAPIAIPTGRGRGPLSPLLTARVAQRWDGIRSTYWFVPLLMIGIALVAALATIQVDAALVDQIPGSAFLSAGGADGARTLLSVAAAAMITVAGVTYSIALVPMALVTAQFGPRLLRNYMRDLGNQVALGMFLATFVYCLLVLLTVRDPDEGLFVPRLSITIAIGLTLISVGVLVYFIHHAASSLQIGTILSRASVDLERTIANLYPGSIGFEPPAAAAADVAAIETAIGGEADPSEAGWITIDRTGYVDAIDGQGLMAFARRHDLFVRLNVRPGTYLEPGERVARLVVIEHSADGLVVGAARPVGGAGMVARQVRSFLLLDDRRTSRQDVEFALQQIVQIAVKAMSPAINDPFTATMCLDRIATALVHLLDRPRPSRIRYDERGVPRVEADAPTNETMISQAVTEIRRYGRSDIVVSVRLLEALQVLAEHARDDTVRAAVRRQAERTAELTEQTLFEPWERDLIELRLRQVLQTLARPTERTLAPRNGAAAQDRRQ